MSIKDQTIAYLEVLGSAKKLFDVGIGLEETVKILNVPEQFLTAIQSVYVGDQKYKEFPCLDKKKNGKLVPDQNSPENMTYLIKEKLKYTPSYNLLKERIYLNQSPITNIHLDQIINEAKRDKLNFSKDHVVSVLSEIAYKNSYHPFKLFVEAEKWDGDDHISHLFQTLVIHPDFLSFTKLYEQYLRRWLIGTVAKVYKSGSQNGVLTLQGAQGKGKSQWLKKLCPVENCYGEGGLNPESKDDILKHLDFVVWHASELDGIVRKRDVAALKDFFTKSDISVRPAYGRFDRTGKSSCSFCASVNDTQFLNDVTGSRRFYIIPIETIEYRHSINMNQVFAQAMQLFSLGEKYWFEGEEIDQINSANEAFNLENGIDDLVSSIISGDDELTGSEIFGAFGWDKPSHGELGKLGSLLKRKGIESYRIKRNGTLVTIYKIGKGNLKQYAI